jgi:hypothetical protein
MTERKTSAKANEEADPCGMTASKARATAEARADEERRQLMLSPFLLCGEDGLFA